MQASNTHFVVVPLYIVQAAESVPLPPFGIRIMFLEISGIVWITGDKYLSSSNGFLLLENVVGSSYNGHVFSLCLVSRSGSGT